jgi:hypothetical protein
MAAKKKSALKLVEETYLLLTRNFNKLYEACKTEEQRNQLRQAYVQARDNFWEAQNRVFQENDPLVADIVKELSEAEEEIKRRLEDLKKIAQVLQAITKAVRLGSSLITVGS